MSSIPAASNDPKRVEPLHPQATLRPPSQVMRLARMGSFFPTRLSFLRSLLRDLAAQKSKVSRTAWNLNDDGYGHAAYSVSLSGRDYTLICYTSPLDAAERTDRVIAEAWDACFVLFDGVPDSSDIDALRKETVRQEAGRYHDGVLVLSRANKSVRLFDHVVASLASGHQPDSRNVAQTGYLMRTTAVYGNGKFGLADRSTVTKHPGLSAPFRLEMLTVWLIREFTLDLVDHVAKARGGKNAVRLSRKFRRQLGIGNSTGLGMAPFLVGHPALINNWMLARETALARVRVVELLHDDMRRCIEELASKVTAHLREWTVADKLEQARIQRLRLEWQDYVELIPDLMKQAKPYNRLMQAADRFSFDIQELVVSLVLEPNGELIDGLADCMTADEGISLDPSMTVRQLQTLIDDHYEWCQAVNVGDARSSEMVWYVSEEKLEPRLGKRRQGANDNCEMPHAIAHFVSALSYDLDQFEGERTIAEFLSRHPQHRHMVQRVQLVSHHPYGEIRDNLLDASVRPIDLLRCKLSFFGASFFDPRSDRWTRITLFAGTPCAEDLTANTAEQCFLPSFAAG